MRYKAFISYSHTHLWLARALQDALYRFGTPWYERSGPRIFRDESGLAAGPDLWEILRAALNESEYFIYLASPESARSFYTQKEIEYWLARSSPGRIILALAKGNIQWNEGATAFDSRLSDALPEVLHSAFDHTPLYVDLRDVTPANCRPTDPLFRDKVATIASALHGKSKDELYGMQISALVMSDAERMAHDAQAALGERLSDRTLLLAAHALRLTEAQGEARLPEAEAALRQVLCRTGGRPLGHLDNRARPAYSMSPDGRWLCTVGTDDQTRLWDLTDAEQAVFEPVSVCHFPAPSWVQLSSDGSWLVAVKQPSARDPSTEVQLWNVCASPPEQVALAHEGSIVQADVSAGGEFLALSTAAPPRILVWYLPPRREGEPGSTQFDAPSLVLNHLGKSVGRFAFSPVDSALCGFSGNEVTVWRLGSAEADVTHRVFRETAPIEACRVSPAGDTLLMLMNKTPQVARLDAGGEFQRTAIEELNDDIVHRLEISPDGRWGLLLSDSGPSYGAELERPTENRFIITSVGGTMNRHAFSRNGHWLATAAGPSEKFPELQLEEPEHVVRLRSLLIPGSLEEIVLEGHDDLITAVKFSQGGNWLATCSLDRVIRLWDLGEMNVWSGLLARLLLQKDPQVLIRDFGFSWQNIGEELTEALEQVQAELVQAVGRFRARRPQILLADDGVPLNCAFSEDDFWLVSAQFTTEERASARLWDMHAKSACAAPTRLSNSARIDYFDVTQTFELSRDGRWLFVLEGCALWELRSYSGLALDRPVLRGVVGIVIKKAEFSAGGGFLLVYTGEQQLLLLNLVSDEGAALDTDQQPVRGAFFTGDDRWVIVKCGSDSADDPVEVRAWPLQHAGERGPSFVPVSGSRTLRVLKTSPRGRWLLASDDDATRLWDLSRDDPRDSERQLAAHHGPVVSACWSPDEQSLVSGGRDGRLLRWSLPDTGQVPEPEELHAIDGPLRSVTADWQRSRIFAGGDGQGTLLTLSPQLDVTDRWALPGLVGGVNLWIPPDLTGGVTGYFSPTGRWLSTWDGRAIRVFDVQRRAERLELPHVPGKIHLGGTYEYSSDERWLVVTRQGRLFLIDMRADPDVPPIELPGHRHDVINFCITSDAHWLVSVDRPVNEPVGYVPTQTCRIWDLWSRNPADSGVILPDLDLGVDRIEVTPDDRWLITSSRDGVRLWPLGTERLLAVAQRCVGREPNEEERQRYAFTTFESQQAEAKPHLA
jgi:WD40 repeat protein